MEYKFIPDLATEFAMPQDGIMSRVLHKDENLNVTLFGFSAGQELSTHSAPTPALLYFLRGEADLRLGSDTVQAKRVPSSICRPCFLTAFPRRLLSLS
jgi:quercetin dioxygenase-like cupin family protein